SCGRPGACSRTPCPLTGLLSARATGRPRASAESRCASRNVCVAMGPAHRRQCGRGGEVGQGTAGLPWRGSCGRGGRPAGRLWPSGGWGGALSVASIALPLALAVEPGRAIDFDHPIVGRPALGLEPVLQTIEFGQINLVLMALVALDCLVARPKWPRGMLIG